MTNRTGSMFHKVDATIIPKALLVAILALGVALRFWGIHFGLPYTYAPDEPTYLTLALQILRTGDLNPHWWFYPSLMIYLNALAQFIFFLAGRAVGAITSIADLPLPEVITAGVGRLALPEEFLVARGLTALFSVGAILVVYAIARRLHPSFWVAVLAALFFTVSPTVNGLSSRIGPDIFALFFLLIAAFFSLQITDDPRWRNYIGAGVAAGFAIGSKYNAGIILIALIAAHCLRFGWNGWRRTEIWVALVAAVLAFFIATPFSIFDFASFWQGVQWQAYSYTIEGHAGQEGNALMWYMAYLWQTEGWVFVLGGLGAAWAIWSGSKKYWVTLSFPMVYFALVSQLLTRNDRTIMLTIPFLEMFAASALWELFQLFALRWRRSLSIALIVVAIGGIVSQPLRDSIGGITNLLQVDSRETARVWIEQNLPAGARIAVEAYSPFVDTQRYRVEGTFGIIDYPWNWYVQNGFEYIVFSVGAYGRYYADRAQYATIVAQYDDFFARFREVKRFEDGGYEIRIYKTGVADLPSHRTAARFGVYGGWVELVGYDGTSSRWQGGESQRLRLDWRTLDARREPLTLTTRLIDREDRAVWQSRAPFFGDTQTDGLWPPGITRTEREIIAPRDLPSGLYRVQIEIDAEGIGRVPYLSNANQPISDKYLLGPFKISEPEPSSIEIADAETVNAKVGNAITLLASAMNSPPRRGDSLALTLYWRADSKIEKDYTVFIHLLDASGDVRAQIDAQPRGGAYPTSLWDSGEIVRDEYSVELPPDLAAGDYSIELGMYEFPSLARLSVADSNGTPMGDRLILTTVKVTR